MKKTPLIFNRNPENMDEVLQTHNELCSWVFNGEGVATRKYDGTSCLVKDGSLWKRREVKKGKPMPEGFVSAGSDGFTGKTVGWLPVTDSGSDKWHVEAFGGGGLADGTYELCGPKVQGNPEGYSRHILVPHSGSETYEVPERSFDGIKRFISGLDIEGIVFHHEDGRMAKIRKSDYNLGRN